MDLPSVETFWSRVEQSRLLTSGQLAALRKLHAAAPDVRPICQYLITEHLVTRWQCKQLLLDRLNFYLGKYRLLDQLGQGGMGTVFKAEQINSGRVVALKVIAKKSLESPTSVARFRREVQAVAALNHPFIITAIDADCDEGHTHFLVMEYVEGRDLNHWLQEYEPLPIDWVCECIRQAAVGLQHAHERGLVHRDVKPSNVLVVADDIYTKPLVKILDLGMARYSEIDDDQELTQTGQILGTPDYIAPEQAEDTSSADTRADIFSLGCTLFKMLTGRVPFTGRNSMEKLMARARRDAPSPSTIRSDVPPELDAVVAIMLAREPSQRYQTPGEVAEALLPFTNFAPRPRQSPSSPPPSREKRNSKPIKEDSDSRLMAFLDQLAADGSSLAVVAPKVGDSSESAAAPEVKPTAAAVLDPRTAVDPEASTETRALSKPASKTPAAQVAGQRDGATSRDAAASSGRGRTPVGVRSAAVRRASSSKPAATTNSAPAKKTAPAPRSSAKPRPEAEPAPPVRRYRFPWYTAVAAACLLPLALILYFIFSGQFGAPSSPPRELEPTTTTPAMRAAQEGATYVEWTGIPVGTKHLLDFVAPIEGPYRLRLHVLEAPLDTVLNVKLDDRSLGPARLLSDEDIGLQSSLALGEQRLGAGPHTIEVEVSRQSPKPNWVLSEAWHALGPFPYDEQGLAKVYGPEEKLDLAAKYEGIGGARLRFEKCSIDEGDITELRRIVSAREPYVMYLVRLLRVERAGRYRIYLGSDGALGVWCNGKQVLLKTETRRAAPYQDTAALDLVAGDNTLVIKVAHAGKGTDFFFTDRSANMTNDAPIKFGMSYLKIR